MPYGSSAALISLLLATSIFPQTKAASKSLSRPVPSILKPWTSCELPGGPDLLQTTPLPEAPMTRPAQTLTGPKQIRISDGVFAAFGYPGSAPFVNAKVELLPSAVYASEKASLVSEFDAINAKGEDTQRNYALKSKLNGFEIYGFDRTALDGNVLGIYLFFDDAHHIATTTYFLNAPPAQRRFSSVQEYDNLRDGFLGGYTACVRKALAGGAPKAAPNKRAVSRKPVHHR